MTEPTADWSDQRKKVANRTASILYGVIAIMSAELAFQPGSLSASAVAAGSLLVGLAMVLARIFVELVKIETHRGSHIRLGEGMYLLRTEIYVMLFPSVVAALALLGSAAGFAPGTFAGLVPYLGVASVTLLGFCSYYVLDRQFGPAVVRGLSWTALSLVLFAAKHLE